MRLLSWRNNPGGIRELEMGIERGMLICAEVVAVRAKANLAPHRRTGAAEDSIHVNAEHLEEWPRPAVFVATASGDGFFIHEGTVDTPYIPFLSMALDQTAREFPKLLRQGSQAGLARRLGWQTTRPKSRGARAGSRLRAFQDLASFAAEIRSGL